MSVPARFASAAPKLGQTPEAFTPYPRPASPSLPPPSVEFARHCANSPSSGRMSVAAVFTNKVPLGNRAPTAPGGVQPEDLLPPTREVIWFQGTGQTLQF